MPEERAPAVLGVDVGGTSIKARLIRDDDGVVAEYRVPTPAGDAEATALAEAVAGLVRSAVADGGAAGVALAGLGVVVPGVVDDTEGTAMSVNLGWRGAPVRERIRGALPDPALPLAFGQDVRAGGLAEAAALAADGSAGGTLAFVPIGTGLASAIVVDGVPLVSGGWAGEIGQLRIAHGAHAGLRVEELASAGGMARRAGAPHALAVADRVRAGDADARRVWEDCVDVLAEALAWLTAATGCDTIVVGGGVAESGALLIDPLARGLGDRLTGLRMPRLLRARHGDAAGSIGAALLARRELAERAASSVAGAGAAADGAR